MNSIHQNHRSSKRYPIADLRYACHGQAVPLVRISGLTTAEYSASLTKLGEKYGASKLEKACEQILKHTKEPNIRIITAVLKGTLSPRGTAGRKSGNSDGHHGITRGAAYFSRKEDDDDE